MHGTRPLYVFPVMKHGMDQSTVLSLEANTVTGQSPDYHLHQLDDAVGIERGKSHVEFVQNAAQRPQVGGVVIWLLLNQLRGHVEGSSLDRRQHQCLHAHGTGKPVCMCVFACEVRYKDPPRRGITSLQMIHLKKYTCLTFEERTTSL